MSSTHTTCTSVPPPAQDSTVLNGPSSVLHVASASLEYRISNSTCSSTLVRVPLLLQDSTLTVTVHDVNAKNFFFLSSNPILYSLYIPDAWFKPCPARSWKINDLELTSALHNDSACLHETEHVRVCFAHREQRKVWRVYIPDRLFY